MNEGYNQIVVTPRVKVKVGSKCVKMEGLSKGQVETFYKDGYVLFENFCSDEECDQLLSRCHQIIREADLSQHPRVVFSTDKHQQIGEDYFLTSGDKVRFFFEENAFDEEGQLKYDRVASINKVGHALHALDPIFKEFTFSHKFKTICRSLSMKHPAVVQSMCILKPPAIGGKVGPHQDSSFLHTVPKRLVGFWIALEDANADNGCLWFAPGSQHKELTLRVRRTSDPSGPLKIEGTAPEVPEELYQIAEVKKGTLVIIGGEVVHKSSANTSDRFRNIYTFHVYDAGEAKWDEDNWLQPTEQLPFPHMY